jgi:myo-inositol 2-dehydrogenase / D-chiro-inositol 1-dehydrogenase
MTTPSSRRQFLQTSAAAAATAFVAQNAHAAGGDLLKIGLIGCGGRGTGAAGQALKAEKNVKLWAMADAFQDKVQDSLGRLQKDKDITTKIDVTKERMFAGFDAYRRVIECCDVVLLCTPPGFRPLHLRAAVEANRHIFAEKPIAVDAPGVRHVLESCAMARKRNLSVVSGLCLRYSNQYREMMRRLHDGAAGEIRAVQANDFRGAMNRVHAREKQWSDMEWQMRNWYYYTWLSGDFNVEQHVHHLDVSAWVLRDQYPVKCVAMGSRQMRTGPEYGNIYDHFSAIYEYANGVKVYSHTRQQGQCKNDMSVYAIGALGRAVISERGGRGMAITGGKEWQASGKDNNFYQTEHDELFASIRKGAPKNDGEYMSKSTLMAIMARMAAYTGQEIGWQQAMDSKEDLTPARYEWGKMPPPEIARPGVTRFV